MQLAFEKFNHPGFFLTVPSPLALFSEDAITAVSVEGGAEQFNVVPVYEGKRNPLSQTNLYKAMYCTGLPVHYP